MPRKVVLAAGAQQRAAFQDLTHGGLWLRWDGTPRDEEIAGRAVVTLPSGFGSLHAVLGDPPNYRLACQAKIGRGTGIIRLRIAGDEI